MVDKEIYALSVLDIKEIIEYTNVTRIPMVPNTIRGGRLAVECRVNGSAGVGEIKQTGVRTAYR